MKKFFRDFKVFITKGNVIDLAVAVIIGAAFGAIVTSLVNDMIMPLIVWIFPVQDLSSLVITLRPATEGGANALVLSYGKFIQAIINFGIIAFMVFLMLKAVMGVKGIAHPKYGEVLTKADYVALKKQGKSKQEIAAIDAEKKQEKIAAENAKKAEAAANT
ncbi:MAG: large conductance mechanosensitive channel protein MscL, partial [Clostridia bacterium]